MYDLLGCFRTQSADTLYRFRLHFNHLVHFTNSEIPCLVWGQTIFGGGECSRYKNIYYIVHVRQACSIHFYVRVSLVVLKICQRVLFLSQGSVLAL